MKRLLPMILRILSRDMIISNFYEKHRPRAPVDYQIATSQLPCLRICTGSRISLRCTFDANRHSFAGSDTTAIALRAIFYFLIKNPETYQSLVHEIEEADRDGRLSPVIEYQQGLKLPYLCAKLPSRLSLREF